MAELMITVHITHTITTTMVVMGPIIERQQQQTVIQITALVKNRIEMALVNFLKDLQVQRFILIRQYQE